MNNQAKMKLIFKSKIIIFLFNRFLDLLTCKITGNDTREDIEKVFRLFDDDKQGYITIKVKFKIRI